MKLNKKEKAFIVNLYREREFGTNWKWRFPEESSALITKLFPKYSDGTTLDMNRLTFKEYPEAYTCFLEEELEYWRSKYNKILRLVQKIDEE